MTAREAVRSYRETWPDDVAEDTLACWVSEIEATIFFEIVATHEGAPEEPFSGISLTEGYDRELRAKEPYSKLYADYMKMKSDLIHRDTVGYETSSAVFAASFADFADFYNRSHAPLSASNFKVR